MSALTERAATGSGNFALAEDPANADGVGLLREQRAASTHPSRSVSAFSFLRGTWEYTLALTLAAGVFVTGSGWFAFGLCCCFLLACRRRVPR